MGVSGGSNGGSIESFDQAYKSLLHGRPLGFFPLHVSKISHRFFLVFLFKLI